MANTTIIIDIETRPGEPEVIRGLMPEFEAPATYKDPVKIAAAIEDKKRKFMEKAALDPLTGQVLSIGLHLPSRGHLILDDRPEKVLLEDALGHIQAELSKNGTHLEIAGYNIHGFDFPFLHTRARLHRILAARRYPLKDEFPLVQGLRSWDLMNEFNCNRYGKFTSFDQVCVFFGLPQKPVFGDLLPYEMSAPQRRQYQTQELTNMVELVKILS